MSADIAPQSLAPGIYHHLPFDQYRELPYLSQSILKMLDRDEGYGYTPLHAKAAFDGRFGRKDTDALRMGRAEHCLIVEGEAEFQRRYQVAPAACQASKGNGDPCGNAPKLQRDGRWYCGVKGHAPDGATEPEEFLNATDAARMLGMAAAVHAHEACQLLKRPGWSEATIVYDVAVPVVLSKCLTCGALDSLRRLKDERFACRICGRTSEAPGVHKETVSLRHKARLDRLAKADDKRPPLILDLKRMEVGEGARWVRERTIRRYGWDVQAAAYTEAVRLAMGVAACHYAWMFVETSYPHDVTWIPASADVLRIGADKLHRYRSEWARCLLTNRWDGYCNGNQPPGGLHDVYQRNYIKQHADDTGRLRSDRAGETPD